MRRMIAFLVLGVFAGGLYAQYGTQEARVRKALAAGKPYKAIGYCERVLIKKDPPARFLVLRADAYCRVGEYEKAIRDAKKAQTTLGDDVELRSQLIGAYLGLGHPDSALVHVGAGKPEDPGAAEEFAIRVGTTYERLGEWSKARIIFDEAVMSYPSSSRMLRERGSCHAMLGDTARALVDLQKAVALSPRDAVSYNSLGFYGYALFGDHAKAVVEYDKAIKQDPNYGYAFSNRGWSEYKLGNTEKAVKDLHLATRKNKGNAYAYRSLGVIDLDAGRKEEACANFRKALERQFTATYGDEVEVLARTACASGAITPVTITPVVPIQGNAPVSVPPKDNAPGTAPSKQNAP